MADVVTKPNIGFDRLVENCFTMVLIKGHVCPGKKLKKNLRKRT